MPTTVIFDILKYFYKYSSITINKFAPNVIRSFITITPNVAYELLIVQVTKKKKKDKWHAHRCMKWGLTKSSLASATMTPLLLVKQTCGMWRV